MYLAEATTVELCQDSCASSGFSLAGLEYSSECCKTYIHILMLRKLIAEMADNRLRQRVPQRRCLGRQWLHDDM